MNKRQLIEECIRRQGIVDSCFDRQREPVLGVIERNERQIAILTSRRAGKTNTVLRAICRDAQDNPNRKYAYIGLSRVTAENIVWKELEAINESHNLRLELQGYRLRAIFPNGADLTLYGADQPGWLKKFKGAKYRGVVIDEAGEFDIDLHDFIFRVIRPCLVDLRGFLFLIGTPGVVLSGYWYAVTNPEKEKRVKGWNVYEWHSFDNPHITDQFHEELEALRDLYGDELDILPWYQREWLGKWCIDNSKNVYLYHPDKNDIFEWSPSAGDRYILAIDAGYADATAFVLGCYNPDKNDELVFIDCYRKIGMHLDEIADKAMEFLETYPSIELVGDPENAHFMAFMREKRGLDIMDAQKLKKQAYIQYLNNSLIAGKTKLLMPQCRPLAREMSDLIKSHRASTVHEEDGVTLGEWKENPKQPNDLCDAALYVHRYALPYTFQQPAPKIQYGTAEYYDSIEKKLAESARRKASGETPWWRDI